MTALAKQVQPGPVQTNALRAIGRELAKPRQQIEETFVKVGARLAEGSSILNRVTKVFEALPAELDAPQLNEASAKLADVGQQARAISDLFAAEKADLAELVEVVATADHSIGDLRRTVKMMGIVAINARVVAASVVGDSDDFDVFTTDITQLSQSANGAIQEFTSLYRQLTDEVGQAARQRDKFETSQAGSLTAIADSLVSALAKVDEQRANSAKGTAQTGKVSRQISSRVASAVMALQVGDATRQRIEHVEAAVETLCELFENGAVGADEAHAVQAVVGALQAAQLAGAADSYETDIVEASAALRDLSAEARTIMDHGRGIYGDSSAGAEAPLAALGRAVGNAAKVLHECESERGKLEQVAGAVLRTVDALLTHVAAVQQIEANMRLVSLNAAVKCAQLGPRGASLNVIARQLRELTGQTVEAAETAMNGLHDAARLAKSFGAAANGEATGRVGDLEHEAIDALQQLQGVCESVAVATGELERDGPAVIALLSDAAETFADQAAIFESMRDLHLRLIDQCPAADGAMPAVAAEAINRIWSGYTMDAERRIHEKLLGAHRSAVPMGAALGADDAAPAAAPSTANADEDDLDALFF